MLSVSITTDNAAFDDPQELPSLLLGIAERIANGETGGYVRDSNGNTVGEWTTFAERATTS